MAAQGAAADTLDDVTRWGRFRRGIAAGWRLTKRGALIRFGGGRPIIGSVRQGQAMPVRRRRIVCSRRTLLRLRRAR
ncbi:hypothetical protein CHELA40_11624 [Chelatococcus asaccharovorans]|nr:hypothetical protein CHELA40_11624 [Chelatococcus asaccharovorans]CAH1684395.1 hypothetical protein CHELA17_63978 [Chelatococcus asaccharovorans]